MDKKASGKALLPFGIFVGIYLATGMILNFQGVEMAFYQLPAPVAAILGILVAFAMFSGKMDEKLDILHKALQAGGRENIRLAMKQVVPTYRDPEEVNCQVQNN